MVSVAEEVVLGLCHVETPGSKVVIAASRLGWTTVSLVKEKMVRIYVLAGYQSGLT